MNRYSPKISVIIPLYNHEKYIEEALNSILTQAIDALEVIIIDDGSVDNSAQVIKGFSDSRVTYVYQTNQGAHNALNRGISLAKGDYVSILNSDDVYHPDRLQKCLKFLEANTSYSVVITEVEGIASDSTPVIQRKTPAIKAWLDWYADALLLFENDDFLLQAFAKNILITTSNFFMRRDVFEKVGGFRPLRYAHDWDMLLRLSRHFNVHLLRDVLMQYRIHESNTVHEADSETKVKYEVNWLIADNIRNIEREVDIIELMKSINMNHYITIETLFPFLIAGKAFNREDLLNFNNATAVKIIEYLKKYL